VAQVLVPGVAQLVYNGHISTQPWAVVHHWRLGSSTADWSQANIQTLCDAASSAYSSNLAKHCNSTLTLDLITAVDIGAAAPAIGSNGTAHPGTGTGFGANNSATCIVVRNHINARYKGGHPRSYWPHGTSIDALNNFQWTQSFVTQFAVDMASNMNAIIAALPGSGGSAAQHCVPLYTYQYVNDDVHHTYRKVRTGLKAVYTVQSYSCLQRFGNQRRRLVV